MPAISLTAYAHLLDQLAERIKTERDMRARAKLFVDFKLTCTESGKLKLHEELKNRGIQLGEIDGPGR